MHKPRNWNWRHPFAFLAIIVLSTWAAPSSARPACNYYSNSKIVIDVRNDAVYCGSTGGTCEECFSIGGGASTAVTSCWSDGWSVICQDPDGSIYVY